jgi:hypothetical protein
MIWWRDQKQSVYYVENGRHRNAEALSRSGTHVVDVTTSDRAQACSCHASPIPFTPTFPISHSFRSITLDSIQIVFIDAPVSASHSTCVLTVPHPPLSRSYLQIKTTSMMKMHGSAKAPYGGTWHFDMRLGRRCITAMMSAQG